VVLQKAFKMAQSLSKIYIHIVFSTKDRVPFLKDNNLRGEIHAYLSGTCKNLDSQSLQIGGIMDHVHILCTLSRKYTVANLIRDLKKESSKWVKMKESPFLTDFHWQAGYGVFSVSPSHLRSLKKYIANQKEHHASETYQDELRRLLQKYNVEYDERYVWD